MKYCRNCGHELLDTDNFCPKCGVNQKDGVERQTQTAESSSVLNTKIIIHRDRSVWQGYLALGSGIFGACFILPLIALSIWLFWSSVTAGIAFSVLATIIIVATIDCFSNYKTRMMNKKSDTECIFFEDDGSVSVVDLRGVTHNLSLDELKKENTGIIGKRGSCYVKLPVAHRGCKTIFCGYCKEELDLSKVEEICH